MKLNRIFKIGSSFIVAGFMAFTFASCDTNREAGDQGVEDQELTETETEFENEYQEVNEPVLGEEEVEYDFDRDYTYEDRALIEDRVRYDIQRTDRELEEIEREMENAGTNVSEETRREWEETKRNLEEERQNLNQNLQELEQSTEENWDNVKAEVNESLRNFENEWKELKSKDVDVNVKDQGQY